MVIGHDNYLGNQGSVYPKAFTPQQHGLHGSLVKCGADCAAALLRVEDKVNKRAYRLCLISASPHLATLDVFLPQALCLSVIPKRSFADT